MWLDNENQRKRQIKRRQKKHRPQIRQEAADRKTALEAGVVLGAQTEAPAQPDNDKEEGDADEKD